MPSHKRLNSIAHSIAHHAVSALSFIHPHLSKECEKMDLSSIKIDLLAPNVCPDIFSKNDALYNSLNGLKKTLNEIMLKEKFQISELNEATLTFKFNFNKYDHYCADCHAILKSKNGKEYSYNVDCMGNIIK